jgi:hypothetical protein
MAANGARSQSEVWNEVSKAQASLSKNVGGKVNSAKSESSLQLALEDRRVVANIDEYIKRLEGVTAGQTDVVGYAFAINGQINSADVYVSNALFKKLWSKMLKAAATEAVAQANGVRLADPVKAGDVKGFLDDADKARAKEQSVGSGASLITREDNDNVVYEARDEKTKAVVHKSYVKKQ